MYLRLNLKSLLKLYQLNCRMKLNAQLIFSNYWQGFNFIFFEVTLNVGKELNFSTLAICVPAQWGCDMGHGGCMPSLLKQKLGSLNKSCFHCLPISGTNLLPVRVIPDPATQSIGCGLVSVQFLTDSEREQRRSICFGPVAPGKRTGRAPLTLLLSAQKLRLPFCGNANEKSLRLWRLHANK